MKTEDEEGMETVTVNNSLNFSVNNWRLEESREECDDVIKIFFLHRS